MKMAEFLAYRVLDGKLKFRKVPLSLKDEVRSILTDLGYAELAA